MAETAAGVETRCFRALDLHIDMSLQSLTRGEQAIDLPELSFRLLAALVLSAPAVIDKDALIRQVWGAVVVSDETLSQRVRLLRQALGEDGQEPRYIAAVRGRGYRLICPVATLLEPDVPVAGTNAIAVLPFTDMSPQQSYRYFADGMQEELLTHLAGMPQLQVASRTSVERFRASQLAVPAIARQLGVGAVIEGSLRVAADRLRITLQLIDGQTDRHLWAETYDRNLTVANIFGIQQELAESICASLAVEYAAQAPTVQMPTANIAAYDAYLVGRYHIYQQTPQDLQKAIPQLQSAVELDPDFAEAWTAMGWAYSFQGTVYGGRAPAEVYPQAKSAVTRALAINSQLANARSLYADILTWYDWDFAAAEREYCKALELDPLNVLGYALLLSIQQRHAEAIALIETRLAANPDDDWVRVNAAWIYFRAADYPAAIFNARRARQHSDAASALGFAYLGQGDTEQALAVFGTDLATQGRQPRQLSHLAVAYYKAGRVKEGQAVLTELQSLAAKHYVSPDLLSDVYFAAGDTDSGFAALNEALTQRSRELIFLRTSDLLQGFRGDPRYIDLLAAVGL